MELYYVLVAVALMASFSLGIRKVARVLYLSSKIPTPSLREMATIHAKAFFGEDLATYVCDLCAFFNFKPWGAWMPGGSFVIVVSDRQTISAVYKNKNTREKSDVIYGQFGNFFGSTLFSMRSGQEYAKHRKSMGAGLHKDFKVLFLPRMCEPMSELVRKVREEAVGGKDVDVRSIVNCHIIASAFGYLFSALPENSSKLNQAFAQHLPSKFEQILLEAINPIYYHSYLRWRPSARKNDAAVRSLMTRLNELILNQKFGVGETPDEKRSHAAISTMIQSYEQLIGGSDKELCEQFRFILMANTDTTSFVANVLLLVLALHQDVQQRLFDEIISVLGKDERPIVLEDLARLKYTEMVIQETMRLYPPGPWLGRNVSEETNLNGILAPKGCTVLMNAMAVHRNPEYFPEPLKFDPDRFAPGASKEILPFSYIPFSAGLRSCPGELHGYLMLKLFLCYALRNFVILPGDELKSLNDIKVRMCLTLHLKKSSLRFVDRIPGAE